ncbi:MAG: hypothetical protein AABY22_07325 [Nanoarchaeota archaeon]
MKLHFSEWFEYRVEYDKSQAKFYLNLWKKFFLRKMHDQEFEVQIIDKPEIENLLGEKTKFSTLGIKIKIIRKASDLTQNRLKDERQGITREKENEGLNGR